MNSLSAGVSTDKLQGEGAVLQQLRSRMGRFWCTQTPMWPIHGHYDCGICRRRYPAFVDETDVNWRGAFNNGGSCDPGLALRRRKAFGTLVVTIGRCRSDWASRIVSV